jgi:FkbM family methyltransferase
MSILELARHTAGGSVKRYLARHRSALPVRTALSVCESLIDGYHNLDYDLKTNGEHWVLSALAQWPLSCFIDAGANIGEWTAAVKTYHPYAAVHSFEIHPRTFDALRVSINGMNGVNLVNSGLSDRTEDVQLHCFGDLSTLTSAIAYPHPDHLPRQTVTGHVVSGDSYVSRKSIGHVDFLKIDVEGMEDKVLRGFEETIRRDAIDLIQFEYGRVNILTHFLLRDFYEFLEPRGYAVGKIYPGGVDFRPYSVYQEDFRGPNYLACRTTKPEYLHRLGRHPN